MSIFVTIVVTRDTLLQRLNQILARRWFLDLRAGGRQGARFFLLACSSCVDVTPGIAERSSVKYLANKTTEVGRRGNMRKSGAFVHRDSGFRSLATVCAVAVGLLGSMQRV